MMQMAETAGYSPASLTFQNTPKKYKIGPVSVSSVL